MSIRYRLNHSGSFTAAVAGIPKSLRDYDLDVDEPFDVDDEDMTNDS